ncbi:DUF2637 domain-containing protein [Actinospica robiniae]|uniref:DUF2637 domain-containing protein n=1 Tax=Actinospica robiniae TaxID=304901 RepID=UPI00042A81D3|nr:DUF2637 domain-containing protein [Actinospica robiniae]
MQSAHPVHSPWVSRTHLVALAVATLLAGAIAGIGMLASFHTVSTRIRPSFKGWAWTVPVTLDASIASFSILELVLLRLALPHILARIAVYAATAATVYLNTRDITAGGDRAQLIAHAAMPCVWALYIELLRSGAAALTRRERHDAEHPVLALLLAPKPVLADWRRGILAPAAPSRPRVPKMSAGCGHFRPRPDLHVRAVRDSADIFPSPDQQTAQTAAPPVLDGSPASTLSAPLPADQPSRVGKGRGLTGRPAVLDLAHRQPELSSAQIAERLNLAPRTVRRHLGGR